MKTIKEFLSEAKKIKKNKDTLEFTNKDKWESKAKSKGLSISIDKDGNFTALNKTKKIVGEWDADDNYGFIS